MIHISVARGLNGSYRVLQDGEEIAKYKDAATMHVAHAELLVEYRRLQRSHQTLKKRVRNQKDETPIYWNGKAGDKKVPDANEDSGGGVG